MGAIEGKLPSRTPFLARSATPRTGENRLPGYYSAEKDMWVVDTVSGTKPLIENGALSQLLTKTKTNNEQDDDSFFLLETITKTFQRTESDDDDFARGNQLLELLSKTESKTEQDDPGTANLILELMTKTNVELERDDNGDPSFSLETRYYQD